MEEEGDILLNKKRLYSKVLCILCWSRDENQAGFGKDGVRQELQEITRSAGFQMADIIEMNVLHPYPRHYIGKGKIEEILRYLQNNPDIRGVVFNTEISPSQQRHLEESWKIKVYTKIALIHRIFAARARSSEGKIKVEAASLRYHLSRLGGKGKEMSRLGGGIGTRGPGEQKIETERRQVKERISQLNKELDRINRYRKIQKSRRTRQDLPIIAIVGYTNAGKSTLLNCLTNAHAYVEDKMFATLDPTARKAYLPGIGKVVFTDTVGFIREMPETLIDAFRATLDEINDAGCLLEVLDLSDPNYLEHHKVINQILQQVAISYRPKIIVFNKIDAVHPLPNIDKDVFDGYPVAMVSATKQTGLDHLMEMIRDNLISNRDHLKLRVHYQKLPIIQKEIYHYGYIEEIDFQIDGMVEVRCSVPKSVTEKIQQISHLSKV